MRGRIGLMRILKDVWTMSRVILGNGGLSWLSIEGQGDETEMKLMAVTLRLDNII